MRSLKVLCSLIWVVLGWAAPGHAAPQLQTNGPDDTTVETTITKEPLVVTTQDPAALKRAEVNWQVIAVRRQGVDLCPTVSGWDSGDTWLAQTLASTWSDQKSADVWFGLPLGTINEMPETVRRLLVARASEESSRELRRAIAADPLLKELDRYCSYRKTSGTAPDFPIDPPPAGLEIATKGHMALAPSGPVSAGDVLAQHFVAQASGGYSPAPPGPSPLDYHPPVRLVFIDTQADGDNVPHVSGPSRHGYTLVHLADQLICQGVTDPPCPVVFGTRLALPYSVFDPDEPSTPSVQGGNLGLVDDLAGAIAREIFTWRRRNPSPREHLVLNLSVGWDGELLGELDKHRVSQLPLDARLVYHALEYARRSEALVIAAAGNRRGGGESNWPLLPAAWELHRPSCWPFGLGPKPVYAVGGVDWQGLPLSNYRFGGLPRRVAFGDHAVAETADHEDATGMYTGSSVSTAVVSSIAAVVWQMRPDLRPAELMRLITQSGDVLPGRGDYYAWKNVWPLSRLVQAPHLRRLSLCRAVTRACLSVGSQCSTSCASSNATSGAADLSAFVLSTDTDPAPHLTTAPLPAECKSASKPTPQFFAVGDPSIPDPCPLYLLPDMVSQRWVAPQPDDPPCPSCSLIPPRATNFMVTSLAPPEIPGPPEGYVLMVDIDAKWWGPDSLIESASLDVDRYSGNGKFVGRMTYAIPTSDVKAAATGNHQLVLTEVGSLAGCTATLNFQVTVKDPKGVTRTLSVQSPAYVDPKLPL